MTLAASGSTSRSPRRASPKRGALFACMALASAALAEAEYSDRGADSCLACHRDEITLAVFSGAHGRPGDARGPFGTGQLQCEACHGPGGRHSKLGDRDDQYRDIVRYGPDSPSPTSDRNTGCIACHDETVGANWHIGEHAAAELACADCHVSHVERDPALSTGSQAAICLDCHAYQRVAATMPYAHPIATGSMTCGDCHAPHGSATEFALTRPTVNETCYQCHAEKRGPVLWEHAPVTEDCSLCHDSHGSNHPAMLARRGPYLCQECHAQAGHPAVPFDGDALAGGPVPSVFMLNANCVNCHAQIHGSNHPSGQKFMR